MKTALAALLLSASIHCACFWNWPGDPDWDVTHSVFAAQDFLAHKGLRSINLHPEPTDDLARHTEIRWMTHWPPAHSMLYVAVMAWGIAPGPATKVLVVFCIVAGGFGWLLVASRLDANRFTLVAIALAYPWLSFVARSYLDYKNDHLASALAPWVYLCVMRIEPLRTFPLERWGRLLLAALLAGSTVLVKYSMIPVLVGSGLYLLYLDGMDFPLNRLSRVGGFGAVLLLPGTLLWSLNKVWGGNRYPLNGGGISLSLPVFAKNIVSHTFGSATGWDLVVIQLNLALEKFGRAVPRGGLFLVCLVALTIWIPHWLRRQWDEKEKQFAVYLCLLTAALLVTLALTSMLSPIKYDFSVDGRFSIPISFGWLTLAAVTLGKTRESILRSMALGSLLFPLVFSALFFAATGALKTPYLRFPKSKTMWSESPDPSHVAFFSQLEAEPRQPDLVIPPDGRFMLEFDVPAFYTYVATRDDSHVYYSSKDLKVLAIVLPDQQSILLRKFRKASNIEQIIAPPGFPFLVYEFRFSELPKRQ